MDEAKTLFCLETGERIPSDAYSRRGHYITCCWGNCSTQSSDEDRSEDQEKQANTDISQCCDEAKCTCADGQSTDEFSGDERQSQFPFVNGKFYNSDGDSDDGETDCESDKECSDKSAVEQEARFGAEEAYAAKGEDMDSLTVSAVRLPPRGACQHSNCGDDTHQSALNYTRAFMEWLGQLTTSKSREGETNTMARTHANDISEAYNAMDRALFDDEARAPGAEEAVTMKSYAELERQLLGMPRRGDVLVDSGSNIHFLTLDDAKRYFRSRRSTNMTVLGISGVREKCNAEGEIEMLVRDHLGKQLHLSLGMGYTSKNIPKSLLSASRIMAGGGILHFEKGNSYIEFPKSQRKVCMVERNGLFYIPIDELSEVGGDEEVPSAYEAAADSGSWLFSAAETQAEEQEEAKEYGAAYGAFATPADWHSRFAHMLPLPVLKKIAENQMVHGLAVRGQLKTSNCPCTTCQLVKIRARGSKSRSTAEKAQCPGQVVSMDVKYMPTLALGGFKYLLCFVDHESGFCMDVPMKDRESETVNRGLHAFVRVMNAHGWPVQHIQTDRGSEFFGYQDGETKEEDLSQYDKETLYGKFSGECTRMAIKHTVIPTGSHEKRAEAHFSWLSKAMDAMLFEARLSPIFWADAAKYACYLHNRLPCMKHGATPYTKVTGKPTEWGHIRKFGSSAVRLIMNDKLAKYPGMPRGEHMIFVGFDELSNGWRLFDPTTRKYVSGAEHADFYEDMSARVDSLRLFDRRRAIEKKKGEHPLIIDDNEPSDYDKMSIEAVRNIYIDPESVDTQPVEVEVKQVPDEPPEGEDMDDYELSLELDLTGILPKKEEEDSSEAAETAATQKKQSKLMHEHQQKKAIQEVLETVDMRRPLRLTAVGTVQTRSSSDKKFLKMARLHDFAVEYLQDNPKVKGDATKHPEGKESWRLYERFKKAGTIKEALALGATINRINDDYEKGFIRFPGRESKEPGHVFMADERASDLISMLGLDYFKEVGEDKTFSEALESAESAAEVAERKIRNNFNEVIANCYEPEEVMRIVEDKRYRDMFAEHHGLRLMCTSSACNYVDIDYTLTPEPDYKGSLEENGCREWSQWEKAREEEYAAMRKFGVYEVVKRHEARGHKLLTSKWVHKRKTDQWGKVNRHKARLVARGFAEREYDSYHPDEVFAHVVDRNTLRTLLSVAASNDLKLYSFDVSNAYLQADLKVPIYMEPPPGMKLARDECLCLRKALSGARSWSDALDSYLTEIGFTQSVADPCLWKRERNGKVWHVASYVDDCTVACTDDEARDELMAEMRKKFEIKADEGGPIEYLLGILISQNLESGTVTMTQELAATKLADAFLTDEEKLSAVKVRHPMLHSVELPRLKEREVPDSKFRYLSAIGSLLYISGCTRPDIAAATGMLARHGATPGEKHVKAVKRLIQYVYNTRKYGIKYSRKAEEVEKDTPKLYGQGRHPLDNGHNHMTVFADSDYGADFSRRSTQGCVVMMNGGPIAWSSVLGKTICCSTAEAEVMAAVSAAKEAVHLKLLLGELGVEQKEMVIQEDNQACIAQVKGGLRHIRKAKHYSVALRFLQRLVLNGDVGFAYCDTNSQLADLFTKPLDEQKFNFFASQIMYNSDVESSHSTACLLNGGTQNSEATRLDFITKRAEETDDPDEIMTRHFDDV